MPQPEDKTNDQPQPEDKTNEQPQQVLVDAQLLSVLSEELYKAHLSTIEAHLSNLKFSLFIFFLSFIFLLCWILL